MKSIRLYFFLILLFSSNLLIAQEAIDSIQASLLDSLVQYLNLDQPLISDSILSVAAQTNDPILDSILNEYNRQYRTELESDDFTLLKELKNIGYNNKEYTEAIEKHLLSKKYSNPMMVELAKLLVNENEDNLKILARNLSLFKYDENSIRPYEDSNYPVLWALENSKNKVLFTEYLLNSEYLNDCKFLCSQEDFIIRILGRTLLIEEKNRITKIIKESSTITCKKINLIEIRKWIGE